MKVAVPAPKVNLRFCAAEKSIVCVPVPVELARLVKVAFFNPVMLKLLALRSAVSGLAIPGPVGPVGPALPALPVAPCARWVQHFLSDRPVP